MLFRSTRKIFCLSCGKAYSMDEAYRLLKKALPPKCSCGGVLKPGTVLFGEPLPQVALDMAMLAARNCDMFLVLGSSLVVYPAA